MKLFVLGLSLIDKRVTLPPPRLRQLQLGGGLGGNVVLGNDSLLERFVSDGCEVEEILGMGKTYQHRTDRTFV